MNKGLTKTLNTPEYDHPLPHLSATISTTATCNKDRQINESGQSAPPTPIYATNHRPRFMRLRRPSEETSDSDDKLFVPVSANSLPINFCAPSGGSVKQGVAGSAPDNPIHISADFVNIPLSPQSDGGLFFRSPGSVASPILETFPDLNFDIHPEESHTSQHYRDHSAVLRTTSHVSHQRALSAPPAIETLPFVSNANYPVSDRSEPGDQGLQQNRKRSNSIVDGLLFEIYDKLNFGRRFSGESDTYTECSTMSESSHVHLSGAAAAPATTRFGWWTTEGATGLLPFRLSFRRRSSSGGGDGKGAGSGGTEGSALGGAGSSVSGVRRRYKRGNLELKGNDDLGALVQQLKVNVNYVANDLVRQLKRRDRFLTKRDRSYDIITAILQAASLKRRVDTRMRFSVEPYPGDSGFAQWHDAMRMVARLPGGIPWEFRKRLWLTMAEKHVQLRKVDWERVKRFCFNDRSNPDDNELGVQIVKDLHRTGCSLFCGEDAEHNQALLKRVLLAYARWNKIVGYCQGFNMLAALILEVMEWKEEDALKVMIYLIEGVLPESYFANSLRGLSVDMAVFRDLLRLRLPGLSRHLDHLQLEARDSASGTSYEPPLTNVFTMQWFLTLFSNCLPKATVLRVWDLIFLEGNEVLLRTALTIWDGLADRIMAVESADEFYSIMGVLTREMLEFGLMDANHLVKTVCTMAPFPFPQLPELRDRYTYNITPFTAAEAAVGVAKRGLRLFYSDDEDDNEDDQLAVAAWCFSSVFPPQLSPIKAKGEIPGGRSPSPSSNGSNFSSIGPGAFSSTVSFPDPNRQQSADPDRMSLDISALKKQYAKLRERQKQAHIILTAASNRQPASSGNKQSSVAMNHLLLGKKPLISKKAKGNAGHSGATQPLKFQFKPTGNKKQPQAPTQSSAVANVPAQKTTPKSKNAVSATVISGGVGSNAATKTTKVPITRSEMNIRGTRTVSGFSGVPFANKDRKNSLPTPESGETLHWRDAKRHRDVETYDSKAFKEQNCTVEKAEQQRDDDASSTSTELCDDDAGVLSELASDLEEDDDDDTSHGSTSTATGATTAPRPPPKPLVVAATVHNFGSLDRAVRSMDESSDGGDTLSVITSTPTATTAPDSIPSVVVSPGGEWPRDDWPDWSRMSVDEDGAGSVEPEIPVLAASEVAEYVSESFRNYFGSEEPESETNDNDNKLSYVFSRIMGRPPSDGATDLSSESDPSSPAFWHQSSTSAVDADGPGQSVDKEEPSKWDSWCFSEKLQEESGEEDATVVDEKKDQDEDDDFSEERRQEWLAKLEMYRRTLGFDNDVPASDGTKCDEAATETTGPDETSVSAKASVAVILEEPSPVDEARPALLSVAHDVGRTAHTSSDEFHSLSDSSSSEEDGIESGYHGNGSIRSSLNFTATAGCASLDRRKTKYSGAASSETTGEENEFHDSFDKAETKLEDARDGGIELSDKAWLQEKLNARSKSSTDDNARTTIGSFESWKKSKTLHDFDFASTELQSTHAGAASSPPDASAPSSVSTTSNASSSKRFTSSTSCQLPTKTDFFGSSPIRNVHTAYVPGSTGSILTNATRRWSSSGTFSDSGAAGGHREHHAQSSGDPSSRHQQQKGASHSVLRRSISKPSSPTKFQQMSNSERSKNRQNFFGSHSNSVEDEISGVAPATNKGFTNVPVFNPFPTNRKSQIWGASGVGIKLGLYDPAPAASSGKKQSGPR